MRTPTLHTSLFSRRVTGFMLLAASLTLSACDTAPTPEEQRIARQIRLLQRLGVSSTGAHMLLDTPQLRISSTEVAIICRFRAAVRQKLTRVIETTPDAAGARELLATLDQQERELWSNQLQDSRLGFWADTTLGADGTPLQPPAAR